MTTAVVRSTGTEIFGITTAEFCLILAVSEVSASLNYPPCHFLYLLMYLLVCAHVCVRRQGVRSCTAKWNPAVVSSQTLITVLLQSGVTALCSGSYS